MLLKVEIALLGIAMSKFFDNQMLIQHFWKKKI